MTRLYILVGAPAVGKSTWIKNNKGNGIVVSSDEERIKKYGYLAQEDPQAIFKLMHSKTLDYLGENIDVFFDATNVSRKHRRVLYEKVKNKYPNTEVIYTLIHKPLNVILEQNSHRPKEEYVPEYVIKNKYINIDPPRINVDCDSILIDSPDFEEYKKEYTYRINERHNSPYHKETINKHIKLVTDLAPDNLKEVAKFHDLGKSICRISEKNNSLADRYIKEIYGDFNRYNNHEKVSAIYYLIANKDNLTDEVLYNTELIFQHMKFFNGLSKKTIRLNKLNDKFIKDLETFNKADKQGSVRDEEVLSNYLKLKNIPKNSLLDFYQKSKDINISPNWDKMLFTIKYKHNGVDFSDKRILNARGLTLDIDSNIITIGFEKFFNYEQSLKVSNETFIKERTSLDTSSKMLAYEKLDGTFISLSSYKDNFVVSTTGSTRTAFSKNAINYFSNLPFSDELFNYINDNNLSLFFEYTSPKNLICIPYNEDRYTLLGARKNDLSSPLLDYREIGSKFNFYLPKVKLLSFDDLAYMRHNNEEIEGVVIVNQFHKLIKYKTEYWLNKHKEFSSVMFSDIFSTKNINLYTQLFVEDSYDDYLSSIKQLSNYVDIDKIVSLFSKVEESVEHYNELISTYQNYTNKDVGISKDISPFLKTCIFYSRNVGDIRNNKKIIYNIFTNCIEDI